MIQTSAVDLKTTNNGKTYVYNQRKIQIQGALRFSGLANWIGQSAKGTHQCCRTESYSCPNWLCSSRKTSLIISNSFSSAELSHSICGQADPVRQVLTYEYASCFIHSVWKLDSPLIEVQLKLCLWGRGGGGFFFCPHSVVLSPICHPDFLPSS